MLTNHSVSLPGGPITVARLIDRYRPILSSPIGRDDFLLQTARGNPSHQFLGSSTQAIYRRQVAFLAAILHEYTQAPADQIKILDWGCGKGHITYLLQARGFKVTSCDVLSTSDDSAFGQEVPIVQLKGISVVPLAHVSQLPFEDQTFDCVVSFGVLEDVHSDVASLKQIRRILKPGGLFFITLLPYFLSWTQALARLRGITYHDRLYNHQQLRLLAQNAGFHVAATSHAQLFPKNIVHIALDPVLEPIDRFLCQWTPLKYLATNLEAVLVAD